jgi:trehalose/maltose hydrolase-like predicted phosphorylase
MRLQDGTLRFAPNLPDKWTHYQFSVRFHGELLRVHVDRAQTVYTLLEGDALSFLHRDRAIRLRGCGTTEAVVESPSEHGDRSGPSGKEAGGAQSSETGD